MSDYFCLTEIMVFYEGGIDGAMFLGPLMLALVGGCVISLLVLAVVLKKKSDGDPPQLLRCCCCTEKESDETPRGEQRS